MHEFKIISFTSSINPNVSKHYSFSPSDSFIWNNRPIEGEYLYHGFGKYREDADTVVSHVVGLYHNITRGWSDQEKTSKELIDDLRNYMVCIRNGHGDKETLLSILNICAMAGCEKQIYETIRDHFNKYNDQLEGQKNKRFALDYVEFYLRVADKLLIKTEIETSLAFYELAGLLWDDSTRGLRRKESNTNKALDKWNTKYNVFSQIMDGAYNLDLEAFEYDQKERLITLYMSSIDKLKAYDIESIEKTNELVEMVGSSFGILSDYERIVLFMIASLKKYYPSNMIYLISDQPDQIKREYCNQAFELFRGETSIDCKPIHDWVQNIDPSQEEYEKLLAFVRTLYYTEIVLDLLRTKSETNQTAYYTSFETFALMFPDNCDDTRVDECGKLSVMNISYMNDPNEGTIIRRHIFGNKIYASRYKDRKRYDSPCVFVKCFTSMVDYLPMWKMYGGNAEGVCIVYNWAEESKHSLFHVCYINKHSRGYSIRKEDNKSIDSSSVFAAIEQIKKLFRKMDSIEDKETFDRLLDHVSYLFKDASYSYEKEMRIMYRLDYDSSIIRKTKHSPPLLYVLHDSFLSIDEIILGPKFLNATNTIPYMKQQIRIICEKNGAKAPAITKSNIDFQ